MLPLSTGNSASTNTGSYSVNFSLLTNPSTLTSHQPLTRRASDVAAPAPSSNPPPAKRSKSAGGKDRWFWTTDELWEEDESAILGVWPQLLWPLLSADHLLLISGLDEALQEPRRSLFLLYQERSRTQPARSCRAFCLQAQRSEAPHRSSLSP